MVFPVSINWHAFLEGDHRSDLELLRFLNRQAEPFIDVIRFEYCRFDLPDTLPGRVGSWEISSPHLGAMVYQPVDHESYLIAGPAFPVSLLYRGIGLKLDEAPSLNLSQSSGKTDAILRLALTLFRDVTESGNETHRFIRAMTLLEYLANPDSYKSWTDLKKEIAVHSASSRAQYASILERFQLLTGDKRSGAEKGIRTLLVHYGKYLEEVICDPESRRQLFIELQGYASSVINDMFNCQDLSWSDFRDLRQTKKHNLLNGSGTRDLRQS